MGPAFLDLQIITNTDLEKASAFFTAHAIGYLVGSLVGGVLYDKFNKLLVLCVSTAGMGIVTAVIPLCTPYIVMIAVHFVSGFFKGPLNTGKYSNDAVCSIYDIILTCLPRVSVNHITCTCIYVHILIMLLSLYTIILNQSKSDLPSIIFPEIPS
jgi:MFS family permease